MVQWSRICILLLWISLMMLLRTSTATNICRARELEKSRWLVPAKSTASLDLFICRGLEYSPTKAFTDIILQLNLTDEDTYELYKGDNCSVVEEAYQMDNRLFGLLKGVSLWKSHQLNVFNDTVIGISTLLPYSVQAKVLKVNYIRLGVFIAGILLFFFANRLVRNAVFFYGSGCSFGLLASLLIIVFIVYRVAPKKLIGLPILIGGWSLSVYILHFMWKNFAMVALQYQNYLIAYFVTVVAVSFAVCYKRGPPTDSRSHDIAQWTLQAISLMVIYSSSQVQEVSVGTIVVLVLHQFTSKWLWSLLLGIASVFVFIWKKFFKPRSKRRLLTLEEYEREAQEVTKRELERLREYCKSPDADVWKITSRVRDPKRLARFVAGRESHVLEQEEDMYDEDSGSLDSEDVNDEEASCSSEQGYTDNHFEDDDGVEWEEEVVIRRTPKKRYENSSSTRERSFAIPKSGSHSMELSANSRSAYYHDSRQHRPSPQHRSSGSPSRKSASLTDRRAANSDSSSARRYLRLQEELKTSQKRAAPSLSNEYLSSDSEPDLQNMDTRFYYDR